MSDRAPRPPEDEGWKDIHLDDIVWGVGSLLTFLSGIVEGAGSAANQSRTPAARPIGSGTLHRAPDLAADPREPLLDLFDEGEEIVVVVEWPDGDPSQIEAEANGDVLALSFGGGAPDADLLLPAPVDPAVLRRSTRNGVTEIRLRRADACQGE
jgi:HSP20 family protein